MRNQKNLNKENKLNFDYIILIIGLSLIFHICFYVTALLYKNISSFNTIYTFVCLFLTIDYMSIKPLAMFPSNSGYSLPKDKPFITAMPESLFSKNNSFSLSEKPLRNAMPTVVNLLEGLDKIPLDISDQAIARRKRQLIVFLDTLSPYSSLDSTTPVQYFFSDEYLKKAIKHIINIRGNVSFDDAKVDSIKLKIEEMEKAYIYFETIKAEKRPFEDYFVTPYELINLAQSDINGVKTTAIPENYLFYQEKQLPY